ncbi:putative Phosphoenolpyruvate-dihydroxyacetone phosphotransferase, subunit DhaM DHA-specific IIA component / DHA-specific phosphocarrier protein HPr / DHA-specific EI component [Streptomyces misionensis JCM 4497]
MPTMFRESRVRDSLSSCRAPRGRRGCRGGAAGRCDRRIRLRLVRRPRRRPGRLRRRRPRDGRSGTERPGLRPVDGRRGDPGADRRRVRRPAVQPVRHRAVRPGVQAGHVPRRGQRRLLHPCPRARRQSRGRRDPRSCHRRRPVVRRQRHPGLLAGRGEPDHRAAGRPGPLGRRPGRADAPRPRQGRHDPDAEPARQRVVQRRLPGRQRGGRPDRLGFAAAVAVAQRHHRRLDRRQLEHGLRRRPGRPGHLLPDPALHDRGPYPGGPREALPDRGPARGVPRLRARAAPRQHRHLLGRRAGRRTQRPADRVPRRTAGRLRGEHQRGARPRQAPPAHPGHLPAVRAAAGVPARHRRPRPRSGHPPGRPGQLADRGRRRR